MDHTLENGLIQLIHTSGGSAISEADSAQSNGSQSLQQRLGVDAFRELLAQAEVLGKRLSKGVQPVITQREPESEGAKGPRQFDRFFEDGESFDGVLRRRSRVFAGMREGAAGCRWIAVEQASAAGGLIQPFVRVKRQRVGAVDSAKCLGHGKSGQRPVSAVDVEPEAMLPANIGNNSDGIDAPRSRGTGTGDNGDRLLASLLVLCNRRA